MLGRAFQPRPCDICVTVLSGGAAATLARRTGNYHLDPGAGPVNIWPRETWPSNV